jgi:integrase
MLFISRRTEAGVLRTKRVLSVFGMNSLAKILPDKLCAKAGIAERKTSHCLRITCATRLFQRSVEEKQIRERTGHRSDSLFRYEKPSDQGNR